MPGLAYLNLTRKADLMQWNVFFQNKDEIATVNIFDSGSYGFIKDVRDAAKSYDEFEDFVSAIKGSLSYYYSDKSEWCTLISSWRDDLNIKPLKVDVYWQIMNAWDAFIEYCWNHRAELRADDGTVKRRREELLAMIADDHGCTPDEVERKFRFGILEVDKTLPEDIIEFVIEDILATADFTDPYIKQQPLERVGTNFYNAFYVHCGMI